MDNETPYILDWDSDYSNYSSCDPNYEIMSKETETFVKWFDYYGISIICSFVVFSSLFAALTLYIFHVVRMKMLEISATYKALSAPITGDDVLKFEFTINKNNTELELKKVDHEANNDNEGSARPDIVHNKKNEVPPINKDSKFSHSKQDLEAAAIEHEWDESKSVWSIIPKMTKFKLFKNSLAFSFNFSLLYRSHTLKTTYSDYKDCATGDNNWSIILYDMGFGVCVLLYAYLWYQHLVQKYEITFQILQKKLNINPIFDLKTVTVYTMDDEDAKKCHPCLFIKKYLLSIIYSVLFLSLTTGLTYYWEIGNQTLHYNNGADEVYIGCVCLNDEAKFLPFFAFFLIAVLIAHKKCCGGNEQCFGKCFFYIWVVGFFAGFVGFAMTFRIETFSSGFSYYLKHINVIYTPTWDDIIFVVIVGLTLIHILGELYSVYKQRKLVNQLEVELAEIQVQAPVKSNSIAAKSVTTS